MTDLIAQAAQTAADTNPKRLWLWRNFVNGRPEYWAFDNPYPIHLDYGDPMTLGEPCGYALVFASRNGRPEVPEEEVLRTVERVNAAPPERKAQPPADHTEDALVPAAQPEVAYYVYEWDTASGVHRDTSPNQWNGMPPTRSVPIYAKPDPRIAELEALLREACQDLEDCTTDEGPEQFELNRARKTLDRIRAALNREG